MGFFCSLKTVGRMLLGFPCMVQTDGIVLLGQN